MRNFVLTCQRRLGPLGAPFEGLTPDKNGVFDAQLLGRYLASAWTGAPAQPLDALIAEEMALVRTLLEPSRLAAIEEALAAVS